LSIVSEEGLQNTLRLYLRVIQVIQMNCRLIRVNPYGEPQLGRRGLYPNLGTACIDDYITKTIHLLSYADGEHDLLFIAEKLNCSIWSLTSILHKLVEADLIRLNFGSYGEDLPLGSRSISNRLQRGKKCRTPWGLRRNQIKRHGSIRVNP
jgi:hypothetical protein